MAPVNPQGKLLLHSLRELSLRGGKPFGIVAKPDEPYHEISFEDLDNAVNRAAWFIEEKVPADQDKFIWMGAPDLRYILWTFAAMKTKKCVSILATDGSLIL